MPPEISIALRFLRSKKRAMIMSLTGIVFGVGFIILTQALTSGFEIFFIKTILGTKGALRIQDKTQSTLRSIELDRIHDIKSRFSFAHSEGRKFVKGIDHPRSLIEAVKEFHNVSAVSEVILGEVSMSNNFISHHVSLHGIDLDNHLSVSDLEEYIMRGELNEFRRTQNGMLIGRSLAQRMLLNVGDNVVIWAKEESHQMRVSAIYETGVSDIDQVWVFTHLDQARTLLKKPFGISFLQVNLHDKNRAPANAFHMRSVLGHRVESWQEREQVWLDVFWALRLSSAITVSTIIIISGLGIFNTLAIIVMEKSREIAILRSIGYTRNDIGLVFVIQGMIIYLIGTFFGLLLGAAMTYTVSALPIGIRGIFTSDHFIVNWSIWHYAAAAITALIVVLIASYIPARKASRLEPAVIIRGAGQ
jgi:lipoprotein-releasing system permease protein